MSMTKRDYISIAATIRAEIELSQGMFEPHHVSAYNEIAAKLADLFSSTNPRFDRAAFIKAAIPSA